MKQRDLWVDYAKGVGILLVVYGHVARGVSNAGIALNDYLYHLTDSMIYSFHMPLFFFLSGLYFQSSVERHGRWSLITDKLRTIVYPYVVWSLLQGSTEVLLSRYTTAKTGWADVLAMGWQPRAQFWFLYVLFLLFVLLTLLYRKHTRWLPVMLSLATAGWIAQQFIQIPFPLDFIASYAFYFLAGSAWMRWQRQGSSALPPAFTGITGIGILCISLALSGVYHIIWGFNYQSRSLWLMPIALSAITGICLVCQRWCLSQNPWLQKAGAAIAWCGRYSMPVFLLHILTGSGVRIILLKVLHISDPAIHIAAGCVAGVIIPVLIYRLQEVPALQRMSLLFQWPRKQLR